MPKLVLSRRQNSRHHLLSDRLGKYVAYLLPQGERRFVPWLGFIVRADARALEGTRPVRLANMTRIGVDERSTVRGHDVPNGRHVHGCLTSEGAYAVYDATLAPVEGPKA